MKKIAFALLCLVWLSCNDSATVNTHDDLDNTKNEDTTNKSLDSAGNKDSLFRK